MTAPIDVTFTTGTTITSEWLNGVNDYVNGQHTSDEINYTPPFTNAVTETVTEKLSQTVSVLDFGATGDGVTNDAPAFQAAIDSGAKYIVIPQPETQYLLEDSLDMTGLRGVTFDFQASTDINVPPILAKHTHAVFDLTGAFDCVFYSPNVEGDSTTTPTCMFLLARNSTGASAGRHRFFNPRSNGNFSTTVFYNYGSEENDVYSPDFMQAEDGKSCVYITSYNSASLTSQYATIATGGQSTVCHRFYGGSFYSQGNSGLTNETVFVLDSASDLSIDGAFMYCPNGIALIDAYSTNATSDVVSITNCRGEISGSLPTYGIYFRTGATRTFTSWRILGNRIPADSYAVYGDNNITFDNFTYEGNVEPTGYSLNSAMLQYSYINHGASYAVTRTSGNNNVWIGTAANRTATGQNGIFLNTADGSVSMGAVNTTIVNPGATTYFIPSADNTYSLGASGARWSVVWAATGTINTSDRNDKTEERPFEYKEKAAALAIKARLKTFKFKDAVEKKGDDARIHFGVIAQDVKEAFEAEGLDADNYGVFCSDVLEDGSTRLGVRYEELLAFIIAAL